MPRKPRTMDRRRFVTIVAMGGAAVVAAPLSVVGAAPPPSAARPRAGARPAASPAVRRELASQERSLAETLKVIRSYELPPGSPMAFAFAPLRGGRKER